MKWMYPTLYPTNSTPCTPLGYVVGNYVPKWGTWGKCLLYPTLVKILVSLHHVCHGSHKKS